MRVVVLGDVGVIDDMMHIGDEAMFQAATQELGARGIDVVAISSAPATSTCGPPFIQRRNFNNRSAYVSVSAAAGCPADSTRLSWRNTAPSVRTSTMAKGRAPGSAATSSRYARCHSAAGRNSGSREGRSLGAKVNMDEERGT